MRRLASWRTLFAVLLLLSVAGNLWLYSELRRLREQEPYLSTLDEPLIERSIILHLAETGQDRESIMSVRFPVVTRGRGGERCVNLMLPRGYLGWTPFYCYDAAARLIGRGQY